MSSTFAGILVSAAVTLALGFKFWGWATGEDGPARLFFAATSKVLFVVGSVGAIVGGVGLLASLLT